MSTMSTPTVREITRCPACVDHDTFIDEVAGARTAAGASLATGSTSDGAEDARPASWVLGGALTHQSRNVACSPSVGVMRTLVLAAVAALLLLIPASARAALHDCNIQATNTATISSARDMSCQRAAKEMRDYRGQISRRFTTPARLLCTRVSGGPLAGPWRCVHRNKAFRFEFAD